MWRLGLTRVSGGRAKGSERADSRAFTELAQARLCIVPTACQASSGVLWKTSVRISMLWRGGTSPSTRGSWNAV